MNSFQNILLCYDSTREGRRALLRGAELAEKLGAETHLLAISAATAGSAITESPSQVVMREEERLVREVLNEGVERLRARGLKATGHLAFGKPLDHIPKMAHELDIDLVIVGHRPCGVLARWWAGPGNAQLLDALDCSVLVSIDPDD